MINTIIRRELSFQFINFTSRKQKTTEAIIFKIGVMIIRDWLTIPGFLTGSLYKSKGAIGMNAFFDHRIPGSLQNRQVHFPLDNIIVNTPRHPAYKQGSSGHFLTVEMGRIQKTYIP